MKMIKEEATHRTGEVMLEEIGLMSRDTELSTYVQVLAATKELVKFLD